MYWCLQLLPMATLIAGVTYTATNQQLTAVPSDIPRNTEKLDLTNNDIAVFDSDKVALCSQLKDIRMNTNQLTSFPNLTVVASTLNYLYLDDNSISVVPYELLDSLENLWFLSIQNNGLTSFPNPPGPSRTMTALKIAYNQFENGLPKLDIVAQSVSAFEIGYSDVGHLEAEDLIFPRLSSLYCQNNGLSKFPNFTYSAGRLTTLILSDNIIGEIDGRLLTLLTSLTTLDLARNQLTHFSNFHVNGTGLVPKLRNLYLSNNRFTSLPDTSQIMAFAPKLTRFYLANNLVTAVPTHLNTSKIGPKLTLDLTNNDMETLPVFDGSLVELKAYTNPIICDNTLKWLLCDSSASVTMSCKKPSSLRFTTYNSLTVNDVKGELC